MMTYWALVLDNFQGDCYTYYFENFESALASFEALCETYKTYDEYERKNYCVSWFDPDYNEYSTYVRLAQESIVIHNTPITEW